jgi:hypothetical protein
MTGGPCLSAAAGERDGMGRSRLLAELGYGLVGWAE